MFLKIRNYILFTFLSAQRIRVQFATYIIFSTTYKNHVCISTLSKYLSGN